MKEYQLKACKCGYSQNQVIYKIALPSSLAETPICWISGPSNNREITPGNCNPALKFALVTAINQLENIHQLRSIKAERKSA